MAASQPSVFPLKLPTSLIGALFASQEEPEILGDKMTTFSGSTPEVKFRAWLREESWDIPALLNWCYFGFGRGRAAPEPNQALLDIVTSDDASENLLERLAQRVAEALLKHPDLQFVHAGQSETSYQLLRLAAGLKCPAQLAAPIWGVYNAKNSVLGENLNSNALLMAMIANQDTATHWKELWISLVGGKSDPVVGGTRDLGFRGLVMMPGNPDLATIGDALLEMAKYYAEDRNTRRQRFRRLVFMVKDRLKEHINLPGCKMVHMADRAKWAEAGHEWAVDALPEFTVESFGSVGDGRHCALVWSWFVGCISPAYPVTIEKEYCGGRVLLVRYPEQVSAKFNETLQKLDLSRSPKSDLSEHEAMCNIVHTMMELQEWARDQGEAKIAEGLEITATKIREANFNPEPALVPAD